jgi:hypothetical protein
MPPPFFTISAPPGALDLGRQVVWLFLLAVPIACIAWTVTKEEIFREGREFCVARSKTCRTLFERKAFYLFTCEFCFSHWVTLLAVILTGYRLLLDTWLGYGIAFFSLVFVANIYMSLYSRLRVDIRSQRAEAAVKERQADVVAKQLEDQKTH